MFQQPSITSSRIHYINRTKGNQSQTFMHKCVYLKIILLLYVINWSNAAKQIAYTVFVRQQHTEIVMSNNGSHHVVGQQPSINYLIYILELTTHLYDIFNILLWSNGKISGQSCFPQTYAMDISQCWYFL